MALSLGAAFSKPAVAALGDPASYARDDVVVAAFYNTTPAGGSASEETADICVPPEEQYIPSFVRDPRGRIVGVNYTIIEYVC
ncbi:hypothetical protein LRX75_21480 [Rhizobium sp. DKSPLA3]|uniref:Uncharacterized protein n=1 Tax=Rhizobium quercicola TaxID=2901226 RepID=A0A9X1T324_9HYPH|nr:hypothetical protein [Rhizobium quercicola]MCD7111609.1 hypothetical protein [Rhizobium quercicola]